MSRAWLTPYRIGGPRTLGTVAALARCPLHPALCIFTRSRDDCYLLRRLLDLGAFHFVRKLPDEAQQFTGDGSDRLLFRLAATHEPAVLVI